MKKAKHSLLSLSLIALIPACASSERMTAGRVDPYADPSQFESLASRPGTLPAPLVTGATLASMPVAYVPETAGSQVSREPASAAAPLSTADEVTTPDAAFSTLIRGNERFVSGAVKGEHRDETRRRALASGQKPFAIVLSCSDSRVPPELIFDQGLGDLFTVRVAGNVLGSAQVASIEYAIEHLGAKLILVMGHESCGAVKAALSTPGAKAHSHASAGSPDLDWLIGAIRPNLVSRGLASTSAEDPKLRKPVTANIDAVTDNLVVRSKIIGDAIAKGHLKVARGIYSLDSGRVDFWGMK